MGKNTASNTMHDVQYLEDSFGGKMKLPVRTEDTATNRHFVAIKEHLYSDLNGEAVILSMKNGKYYGLNEVGRRIWNVIKEPANLDEIQARILDEYEVDEETCYREVSSFLQKMLSEGLIEVLDEKAA